MSETAQREREGGGARHIRARNRKYELRVEASALSHCAASPSLSLGGLCARPKKLGELTVYDDVHEPYVGALVWLRRGGGAERRLGSGKAINRANVGVAP